MRVCRPLRTCVGAGGSARRAAGASARAYVRGAAEAPVKVRTRGYVLVFIKIFVIFFMELMFEICSFCFNIDFFHSNISYTEQSVGTRCTICSQSRPVIEDGFNHASEKMSYKRYVIHS